MRVCAEVRPFSTLGLALGRGEGAVDSASMIGRDESGVSRTLCLGRYSTSVAVIVASEYILRVSLLVDRSIVRHEIIAEGQR